MARIARPQDRQPVRRPQARGVATRARLLKIAKKLFSREGYAAVSRADLARHAGVGMSTVYHHFPQKRDLLLELIDEWGEGVPRQRRLALDVERTLSGDARQATRDFLRRSLEQLEKGPSFFRVILTEAERDPEVRRRYERAQAGITSWKSDLIVLGQRSGVVRSEIEPAAAAFLLHQVIETMLTELVSSRSSGALREQVLEELTELIYRFVFRGPLE